MGWRVFGRIAKTTVGTLGVVSVCVCLCIPKVARAASGTLYLAPSSGTVTAGSEILLALRINPGGEVNGVQATVSYDSSKLQFVSASDTGTAFPEVAEQNVQSNPMTLTRTTTGGSVSSDALIITFRFRAAAGSGSTNVGLSGNAGQGTLPTNPSTQGATITFTSPSSPTPSVPSAPSSTTPSTTPSTPSPGSSQQPSSSSEVPVDTSQPTEVPLTGVTLEGLRANQDKKISFRTWLILAGLGLVAIASGGYWLVRRHRATPGEIAAEHPIDATWASPSAEQASEDDKTEELLSHMPDVPKPDPGSIIAPRSPDDKK